MRHLGRPWAAYIARAPNPKDALLPINCRDGIKRRVEVNSAHSQLNFASTTALIAVISSVYPEESCTQAVTEVYSPSTKTRIMLTSRPFAVSRHRRRIRCFRITQKLTLPQTLPSKPFSCSNTPIPPEVLARVCEAAYLSSSWKVLDCLQKCSTDAYHLCTPYMSRLVLVKWDGSSRLYSQSTTPPFPAPWWYRPFRADHIECLVILGNPDYDPWKSQSNVSLPRLQGIIFGAGLLRTWKTEAITNLLGSVTRERKPLHLCMDFGTLDTDPDTSQRLARSISAVTEFYTASARTVCVHRVGRNIIPEIRSGTHQISFSSSDLDSHTGDSGWSTLRLGTPHSDPIWRDAKHVLAGGWRVQIAELVYRSYRENPTRIPGTSWLFYGMEDVEMASGRNSGSQVHIDILREMGEWFYNWRNRGQNNFLDRISFPRPEFPPPSCVCCGGTSSIDLMSLGLTSDRITLNLAK